ncbi:MAG: protein-L-isoaspartate(D-aspartate) O-methyltransferase [Flavobacteriales bacterium]|nr:protein-L-isoaspartate(D-aspartate) O-methyltransferase [Flavobacteriales bacterium]
MEDTYRHKGLRKRLMAVLREKGIHDEAVLAAMERVPRHWFMESAFLQFAYDDKAFPIGAGQTISQPYTVAFQTSLLELKKGEKVLEVGTGSGYQTCVLLEMGVKVFSIERQRELYGKTKKLLEVMNYRPRLFYGDGYAGLPAFAPFDKVLVTAGAPFIPPALIEQLKPGGCLVIPVGEGGVQVMTVVKKDEGGDIVRETFGEFRFVPLLEDKSS